MKSRIALFAIAFTGAIYGSLAAPAFADTLGRIDPALEFGMSETALAEVLSRRCDAVETVERTPARFPLAAEREAHLVCDGLSLEAGGRLDRAVFTAGDDVFHHVEARGGVDALAPEGEAMEAMGYRLWLGDLTGLRPQDDRAWVMSPQSAHPNLFAWENPLLDGEALPTPQPPAYAPPPEARFGESLEALTPEIEAACAFSMTRPVEASLPTGNTTQTQIDCYGYDIAGFPRKIEFVFGDDRLELIWILTGEGDEARLREELTGLYGEAINPMPGMEFFPDAPMGTALRTDKPEILHVSDAVYNAYFGGGG
jgi:hypothetical protein